MKRLRFTPLYIFIISCLLFSVCGLSEAGEDVLYLSLEDALAIAVINNFDIQLASYDRAIEETRLDDAFSIYDTTLEVSAEYGHDEIEQSSVFAGKVSEDYEVGLSASKKLATGTDAEVEYIFKRNRTDSSYVELNPYESSELKFTFTQPLMRNILGINDAGDIKTVRIEVDNFRSETLDGIEGNIADVECAYWELALKRGLLDIRRRMYERAKEFYEIVEENEKIGSAELTDLYAAKANLKLRGSELIVEESKVRAAENTLKLLMNNKETYLREGIFPTGTVDISGGDIGLARAMKTAFDNRRDYRRAMGDIESKEITLKMKRNETWPQLDLEGSFKMNAIGRSMGGSFSDMLKEDNAEYFAGMTFSFPLEAREATSAYDKAKLEKAKALLNLKKTEKTIAADIDTKVRMVNALREKAGELLEVSELQRYKMREETTKYRYGRSDSDRIIRFQEDYLNAEIAKNTAALDYMEALIELYLAQNIYLNERNLSAP